ncbi:MAG: EAL domain-containing protein [Gammaproteobacteria bacterium]|nr:EAL domain-containing protein [Gammaproteobacteria bacterium]
MDANLDAVHDRLALVVDDDDTTRMIARRSLEASGFDVVEAADGVQALEHLGQVRPDVVLLDVDMPRLDGLQTCRQLRARPELSNTPVVMLTAHDDSESIERAFAAGATDFAAKPVNWALLQHRLRYVLRSAHTLAELARAQRTARMGSWECSVDGGQMRWSEEFHRLAGTLPEQSLVFPDSLLGITSEGCRERLEAALEGALQGRSAELVHDLRPGPADRRASVPHRTVQHRIEVLRDYSGRISHLVGTVLDVSERQRAMQRVHRLAYFDEVTSLPNRTAFREELERVIVEARANAALVAVLYIDLDDFKRVNDSLGHSTGDVLLAQVAARLCGSLRGDDVVARLQTGDLQTGETLDREPGREGLAARLGGDEFAVMLEGIGCADDALQVAHRILRAFDAPFRIDGEELFTTPTIGVSVYPVDGDDAETMLKHADAAMYQAKRAGKRMVLRFNESLSARAHRRQLLDGRLRRAQEHDELSLHYQPQIDISNGKLVGLEALLRWNAGELGQISPAEFIPLAEDNGLIVPIGAWVIRTACEHLAEWRAQGLGVPRVSVNVSARQFAQKDFVERVARVAAQTGLRRGDLEVELTESILASDADGAVEKLARLRDLGIRIAVDDFGTGYSSLSYLKHFPIDRLKIDRSFIQDIATDPNDASITSAVIGMGRGMGLRVLAEGVENDAQLSCLRRLGCDEVQGFLFSKPLPWDQVSRWVRELDVGGRQRSVGGMQQHPKVVVWSDDLAAAEPMAAALAEAGYGVTMTGDGTTALEHLAVRPGAIFLVDAGAQGEAGLSWLRNARCLHPEVLTFLLVPADGRELLGEAVSTVGLDGGAVKPVPFADLHAALQRVLRTAEASRVALLSRSMLASRAGQDYARPGLN